MTFGAEIWGPALISALGSIGGGILGRGGNKETKTQKTQRKLIDQLIASLGGNGPYSDLFNTSDEAFQKSFVEPAQSMFRNKIAPQIQQQYIAHGQQRGTGLDDTLTRAGVDLDSMLNQYLYQHQQDALNRKQGVIGSILGASSGAPNQTSVGRAAGEGFAGFLNSEGFENFSRDIFKDKTTANQPQAARKGYEP